MAKISANKLAELMVTASSTRRRRIVADQKHPQGNIVPLYRLAHDPVSAFLTGGRDVGALDEACRRLRADGSGSDWAQTDRANTSLALEHLRDMADKLPTDATYQRGPTDPGKLTIAGVSVSVRPDFVLTFEKRGRRFAGALKLHYIKNPESALKKAGAEYVSVLLHEWLKQFGPEGHAPVQTHCLSADVFRGAVVPAPRSITRRWDEITAACEEVAARWPML